MVRYIVNHWCRPLSSNATELIAGEGGLGWSSRLVMIDEGLRTNGARGFSTRVSTYLAARYGCDETQFASSVARAVEVTRSLVDCGVKPQTPAAAGYGEPRSLGGEKNRRIEILI
jgi:hypothetical protein